MNTFQTLTEIQELQVSNLSSALLILFINFAEDLPVKTLLADVFINT